MYRKCSAFAVSQNNPAFIAEYETIKINQDYPGSYRQ
jgi:hypothetical protein